MMRFAINGFGRVGRTLLRVYHSRPDAQAKLELAAINEIADADTVVHLARYDSNYGRYPGCIARSGDLLAIDQFLVPLSHESEVAALPWDSLDIDMVFECTGSFTDRATSEQHLHAGWENSTRPAPAWRCCSEVARSVKAPVHSKTISISSESHGRAATSDS